MRVDVESSCGMCFHGQRRFFFLHEFSIRRRSRPKHVSPPRGRAARGLRAGARRGGLASASQISRTDSRLQGPVRRTQSTRTTPHARGLGHAHGSLLTVTRRGGPPRTVAHTTTPSHGLSRLALSTPHQDARSTSTLVHYVVHEHPRHRFTDHVTDSTLDFR